MLADTSDRVTRMDIDSVAQHDSGLEGDDSEVDNPASLGGTDLVDGKDDHDFAAFSAGMFKPVPAPILQRPEPPAPCSGRGKRGPPVPSRSSARLAARPSPIPVAERAQHKLMRELDFLNNKAAPPDAAVNAYIDTCGEDLPEQAVKAIRAAAKLDNSELSKALAAIAAESGMVEMEAI